MDIGYWATAARAFARNLTTPGFLKSVARSGFDADAEPKAPIRFLLDAYPEVEGVPVEIGTMAFRRSNLGPMEQFCLASISRLRQPKTIFEVGTYDGATTLLLARSLPSARILTLDLDRSEASIATVGGEVKNALAGVGSRFAGLPEAERIEQLFGDSRSFDFSPWFGQIDLVIVDGGHEYDCAAADTATALRLVRPNGIVVWDDYIVARPGVVRAVDECAARVFRLANSRLAVYDPRVLA